MKDLDFYVGESKTSINRVINKNYYYVCPEKHDIEIVNVTAKLGDTYSVIRRDGTTDMARYYELVPLDALRKHSVCDSVDIRYPYFINVLGQPVEFLEEELVYCNKCKKRISFNELI